jgi:hypothetical protein
MATPTIIHMAKYSLKNQVIYQEVPVWRQEPLGENKLL